MKTLVITLPSAVERHAKIKNNFKLCNIDYSIVNGVSNSDIIFNKSSTPSYTFAGKTFEINHENLLKYTKRSWVRFGEIAALMAHYKIWKDLCNDPVNEVYLICEDDCFPSSEHIMSNLDKFDYSKLDYDMVFTSPPYYNLELYSGTKKRSKKEWEEDFYTPIFTNTFKYLKSGGFYCLNISQKIYNDIAKKILGEANELILLKKSPRFKKEKENYKEYIYVWKKNGL
jgi:hypothetical protein